MQFDLISKFRVPEFTAALLLEIILSFYRVIRQRRIFRWLNSQKSQTARRIRQLERERRRPDLFQKQEVVEVQKDETIDEQNEEIDVMGI